MVHAHAWVGPYDGGWHCYHCGTTVTLPTGQEPDVAGCPVTTDELLVRFRERPNGWSRRSWATLAEMLQQERDEALRWKAYWAEHYDQCCQDISAVVRERDEARTEVARLTADRLSASGMDVSVLVGYEAGQREVNHLRALLREVLTYRPFRGVDLYQRITDALGPSNEEGA